MALLAVHLISTTHTQMENNYGFTHDSCHWSQCDELYQGHLKILPLINLNPCSIMQDITLWFTHSKDVPLFKGRLCLTVEGSFHRSETLTVLHFGWSSGNSYPCSITQDIVLWITHSNDVLLFKGTLYLTVEGSFNRSETLKVFCFVWSSGNSYRISITQDIALWIPTQKMFCCLLKGRLCLTVEGSFNRSETLTVLHFGWSSGNSYPCSITQDIVLWITHSNNVLLFKGRMHLTVEGSFNISETLTVLHFGWSSGNSYVCSITQDIALWIPTQKMFCCLKVDCVWQ